MVSTIKAKSVQSKTRLGWKYRNSITRGVSITTLMATLAVNPSMAQDVDGEAKANELILEEIVVTARFRKETVQKIGGSISAYDGKALARAGASDFEDIAALTAGLNLNDRGPNQNDVSIRGISNGALQGLADTGLSGPLISQFLDDIPVSSSTASQKDFNYFDFERVEVLRGPQPTFFGEGSVGGTIRYATRDPDLHGDPISDSIAKMGVSFTKDGGTNYSASAATSVVLVPEKFAVRGVLNYRDDDGFIDNTALGTDDVNDYESLSGRIITLAKPTDTLSIRLMGFWGSDDIGENNAVAAPPALPDDLSFNLPVDGKNKDKFQLYSGKVEHDAGQVSITSITGLFKRQSDTEFFCGSCVAFGLFLPKPIVPISAQGNKDRSFTQEFRVVSQFEGPLSFIAGLYYQDTKLTSKVTSTADGFGAFVALPAGSDILFEQFNLIESEQYSAFGEVTYEISDQLSLTGGVRYVSEKIINTTTLSTLALGGGVIGFEPPFVLANLTDFVTGAGLSNTGKFKLDKFLPRAAIEYEVTDNAMIYAVVSTGVRNGNLNPSSSAFFASGGDPVAFADFREFSDDEVFSIEGGVKSNWLGGAMTTNFAVYHTSFENMQVEVSVPFTAIDNAPDMDVFGIEAETAWRVNEYIDVYFNGAYQNAEFQDNKLLAPATLSVGIPFDLRKGNRPANSPEWSFSTGANGAFPLKDSLSLIGHVGYSHTGSRFSTVTNVPSSKMEPLDILNLRLGLEGESWSLVFFVSNLTNDVEFVSIAGSLGLPVLTPSGELDFIPTDVAVNRPRTIGLETTFRF
ncbi:TonB-dependent receptor [Kordiimonas sp.]|uniref:TonB-dependent receptor n=1 Tax=Kordiimonas sp. TaxID=1970157 RepID=UPI003A8FB6EC